MIEARQSHVEHLTKAPSAGTPVIELAQVDKVFANGMRGLEPIDLRIMPGEFVSLIGPS